MKEVIEFLPNIENAKNLTGVDDLVKITEYLQKPGIPFKPGVSGGKISNIQIAHIWVKPQKPYENYRGTVIDEHGKVWLRLCTSLNRQNQDSPLRVLSDQLPLPSNSQA